MTAKMKNTVLVIFLLVWLFPACSPLITPKTSLTPITVQLRWTHQAQFAGMYAADLQGYFAEQGLAVTFLEGMPTTDFIGVVLDDKAQFGITNADSLIIARSQGKPVTAITTIYQRSPSVFITLANSGITRPQDFIGKTIEIGVAGVPRLRAMMSFLGISPDQYEVVYSTSDLTAFYSGVVDVRLVNINNEVLAAKAAGNQLNLIFPDDYGIHFAADTVFTSDSLIEEQPELVLSFLRAVLKGWRYAIENPDQAGRLVAHYNPRADQNLENEKMIASLPLIIYREEPLGWMNAEIWAGMEKTLREQGQLSIQMDISKIYDIQFLKEVYTPDKK
jgi:ABC-type nitrate/sulfonate/bicarbonate transport system substrate-binding protein